MSTSLCHRETLALGLACASEMMLLGLLIISQSTMLQIGLGTEAVYGRQSGNQLSAFSQELTAIELTCNVRFELVDRSKMRDPILAHSSCDGQIDLHRA